MLITHRPIPKQQQCATMRQFIKPCSPLADQYLGNSTTQQCDNSLKHAHHPSLHPAVGVLLQEVEVAPARDDWRHSHLLHVRHKQRGIQVDGFHRQWQLAVTALRHRWSSARHDVVAGLGGLDGNWGDGSAGKRNAFRCLRLVQCQDVSREVLEGTEIPKYL